eukprot:scaffold41510_cov65-Phaeocystis_antarctica.AAC.1
MTPRPDRLAPLRFHTGGLMRMVTGWGSTPTSARIWRPITTRTAGTTLTTTTEVSSPVPWKAARTASVSRVLSPVRPGPIVPLLRHAAPLCVRPPLHPAPAAANPPPGPAPRSPHHPLCSLE